MNLTDNERRDAINLINQGKNLPEKYRFLLFDESQQVELNWNQKTNEFTNVVLPFQTIEQVDEPRNEDIKFAQGSFDFNSGRQTAGWTNKLIYGDNKYILSSLKNGPMREQIQSEGGIKLIYIDPPFSVGMDYTIPVKIGEETYDKKPSILENLAYRNTWNKEGNTFLQMLYERISFMRDLLDDKGAFVLRIDHHWGHYAKAMCDEIFGKDNFRNEIIINRTKKNSTNLTRQLMLTTSVESLFVYSKTNEFEYIDSSFNLKDKREGYWRAADDSAGENLNPGRIINGKIYYPPKGKHFKFSQENIDKKLAEGKIRVNQKTNKIQYYVEPSSKGQLDTNWTDIPGYSFSTGYPTENHEALLERVLKCFTNENDLVCDFFNGSGTTANVCEKLNRKWLTTDIGKFSIHTTRKRLIDTQRTLKKEGRNWRAFEILNIGKYQIQHYSDNGAVTRDENKKAALIQKNKDFKNLILEAYGAIPIDDFKSMHGKKAGSFVSIGPIDQPLSRNHVQFVIDECLNNRITSVDILGFEYEMGLFPTIQEEAKSKGLSLKYKQIPMDVFDKRALDKNEIIFHDVSYIEIKPHISNRRLSIELTDFAVFYNDGQNFGDDDLKSGKSQFLIRDGLIIQKKKDKLGIISEEIITKNWHDWIDYWAVDFDFESKPEIIRFKTKEGKIEEEWTGNYVFENEWQSFRKNKTRNEIELRSSQVEILSNKTKVAVKVVDVFGNDTMKVMEVKL